MGSRYGSLFLISMLFLIAVSAPAPAQNYPNTSVKLITQGAPASGPDVVARIVFDELGRQWKQQVVVLNVAGAGGSAAAKQASAAPADGYTLYLPSGAAFIVMPDMFPDLKIDMFRDFVPVGFVAELPFVIGAAPALNVSSLSELIALSKAKPGTINFAANLRGALPQLTAERVRVQTGADLSYVPYPGAAAAMHDLMGGRISVIVEGLGTLLGPIRDGSLKALAITAPQRLPEFPEIPTAAETLPGFVASGWFALLAPRGTPNDIVRKINRDLNAAVSAPAVKDKLRAMGTMTRPMSLEETEAFVRAERDAWQPTVKQLGFATRN